MARRLDGKRMIITGGASGIAAGVAEICAAEGAHVTLADINLEGAEKQAEKIRGQGGRASAAKVDLSDEESIKALVAGAAQDLGGIDALVNAAADTLTSATKDGPIETMDFEVWDWLMKVNVRGTAMMTKHVVPHLRNSGKGSIVNFASGAAIQGADGITAYGAGKAAICTLTLYTATQHGKEGIRCNAILPGLIVTPATENDYAAGALGDIMLRHTLTPRLGKPSDMAWAVVWLTSDESEFMTGQCISVDGGQSAHAPTWADMRDLMAGKWES